jgi:hypothetical protein
MPLASPKLCVGGVGDVGDSRIPEQHIASAPHAPFFQESLVVS